MNKVLQEDIDKGELGYDWQEALHPGEIIRRRFFGPLEVSQVDFCNKWGIEPSKFSKILKGTQSITPDTATALSGAFGMSALFFLNLQSQYDLAKAQKDKTPKN